MIDEKAKAKIAAVVASYEALRPKQRHALNEEAAKQSFILPLFEALGWDPKDPLEVFPEDKVSSQRVDYGFKINDVAQFLLEAKAPHVDINEAKWVQQAITYAVNRGVTFAALTNFERLDIFWALGYRDKGTNIQLLRWKSIPYSEYVNQAEQLWLLSKESFQTGQTLEAARKEKLPPAVTVEKRLYNKLREWRERLWNELAQFHGSGPDKLGDHDIDEVIERLFNRLIFIRTCEDRGLEERKLWQAVERFRSGAKGSSLLPALRKTFVYYRSHYDSDLFPVEGHLVDDPSRVHINDPTLAGVIEDLYQMPGGFAEYDFHIISADVLGQVYEQYLGHVAVKQKERQQALEKAKQRREGARQEGMQVALLDDMDSVSIVEKRAKRKEQGIYYTPQWVVDYIVRQTVRKTVEEAGSGKGAKEQRLNDLAILDPACGSGSFLIRAYDELLRLHAELEGRDAALFFDEGALWLKRNICGVDLDPQAVDIARLNLMVRALVKRQKLPELRQNIRVGNSLVEGSESDLHPFFGDDWEGKHPLDYAKAFPEIMAGDGFDVVIGNPPYVRIQSVPREDADYYRERYESAHGSFDLYVLFIERGLQLLRPGGRLGFITSGKFLKAEYGQRLQALIRKEATVEIVGDLSAHADVFGEATTYPVVLVLKKGAAARPLRYVQIPADRALPEAGQRFDWTGLKVTEAPQEAIGQGVWPLPTSRTKTVMGKLEACSDTLGTIASNVFQGLITSADAVYTLQVRSEPHSRLTKCFSKSLGREVELEPALLKPLLSGKHIERYFAREPQQVLLFPYRVTVEDAELIPPGEFEREYPRCWRYLLENRGALEGRESGKMRHERWYAFGRTQSLGLHGFEKLAIPRLVKRLGAFYDSDGQYYLDNVDVGGLILKDGSNTAYKYVLALLNSALLDWYFRQRSAPFRGGFRSANRQFLEPLPIRRIDSTSAADQGMRNRLIALVERMLELQKRLAAKGGAHDNERQELLDAIRQTDREIDALVYELYGLTKTEVALVEGETPTPKYE